MNLNDIVNTYLEDGYTNSAAISKMCQDIILYKIKKSSLAKNITVKGGVVLMGISNDKRRATIDLDIDFIKYSLNDKTIISFVEKLSDNEVKLEIISKIKKLSHQDYDGKRISVQLSDKFSNKFTIKLDIGVHKDVDVLQDELCFNFKFIKESVTLLVNSKEQIFVEKLKSILKHGITTTRYKDIFDFYYLINETKLDKNRLVMYIDKIILKDNKMKINSIAEIRNNLKIILNNKRFKSMLNLAKNNWLEIEVDDVVISILTFFETIEMVAV